MQRQRKLCQTLPEFREKRFGVHLVLKTGDDIVGISHARGFTLNSAMSPPINPEVEDVVKIDVCKQRRDHRALRSADRRCCRHALVHHPGFEPSSYQAEESSDRQCDVRESGSAIHGCPYSKNDRRAASTIQFTFLEQIALSKRVKRIVLAVSRPRSIRETDEVGLVNGIENLDNRTLDDLVLQRGDAQRAFSTIRLRDHPTA